MKTISQICKYCKVTYEANLKEVKRGNGKYCSRPCAVAGVKIEKTKTYALKNTPNVHCSYCKKEFYLNRSKKNNSKSGLFFCCRTHKDLAQRLEFNLKEIHPSHYANGLGSYREIALRNLKIACKICNYSKIPEILQVHHIDRNRNNNSIDNLEIICPNCHMEEHFSKKDGFWS